MKVFIPARHGLGNVIEGLFIKDVGRKMMSTVWEGFRTGQIKEIVGIYEDFMNPAIATLFKELPFPVRPVPTSAMPGVPTHGENQFPNEINGYLHAYRITENARIIWKNGIEQIKIPTKKVEGIPSRYVLFTGYAGQADRFLTDPGITDTIREATKLPIVCIGQKIGRNGSTVSPLTGDINLVGKLSITQVMWIAEHAAVIVSACSYLRTCATLFGKRVIEIVETSKASNQLIQRTLMEYQCGDYGIKPGKSFWWFFPEQKSYIRRTIGDVL